jgi:hypothetical protein
MAELERRIETATAALRREAEAAPCTPSSANNPATSVARGR